MVETPGTNSLQPSLSLAFSIVQDASTLIEIKDENDNVICSFSPLKSFQSIIFSSEELKLDQTYNMYVDNVLTDTFTQNQIITYVGTNSGKGSRR